MIGLMLLVSLLLLFIAFCLLREEGGIARGLKPWLFAAPFLIAALALQICVSGTITGSFLFIGSVSMMGMIAAFIPSER
ncbi:hypothetical protein IC617_15010 [Neiella sp. HB171785]|uniref:Uncharacterized protein n=1 Tax=Neiella litorisoli TaxID=2771431 RepID=A0A8J6QTP4_9GAMM|nr:hypothetical protein [Neiella litorisoli]MBD1390739.1 hypothetical protein [Neiella litorisoli]